MTGSESYLRVMGQREAFSATVVSARWAVAEIDRLRAENGRLDGVNERLSRVLKHATDELDRLRAEVAADRARSDWFESRDVEVRHADEDDGIDFDDEDEGDEVVEFRKWGVVVWVAGRGRTSYGDTLNEAIDAAMANERSTPNHERASQ